MLMLFEIPEWEILWCNLLGSNLTMEQHDLLLYVRCLQLLNLIDDDQLIGHRTSQGIMGRKYLKSLSIAAQCGAIGVPVDNREFGCIRFPSQRFQYFFCIGCGPAVFFTSHTSLAYFNTQQLQMC